MATERQVRYLRTLGIDPRVDLEELSKAEASRWISELKEYADRAALKPAEPLTHATIACLNARDDALVQPPSRSVALGHASVGDRSGEVLEVSRSLGRKEAIGAPSDESWCKVELSVTRVAEDGNAVSVLVSGSEHPRRALAATDAEELAGRLRRFLIAEAERMGRESPVSGPATQT